MSYSGLNLQLVAALHIMYHVKKKHPGCAWRGRGKHLSIPSATQTHTGHIVCVNVCL